MRWYQILIIVLAVYVLVIATHRASRAISRAVESKKILRENICLIAKQVKKLDQEILKEKSQQTLVYSAEKESHIQEMTAERTRLVRLSENTGVSESMLLTMYCKPCSCEEKDKTGGPGGLPDNSGMNQS